MTENSQHMLWLPSLNATTDQPKAVALVIHGLNLKPDAMMPTAEILRASGVDVLFVTLSGHNTELLSDSERMTEFKQVSYSRWRQEVQHAYEQLEDRANQYGVQKFLVGYSIGALLGVDILLGRDTKHTLDQPYFDKMVLLAPALAVRPTSHFLRPLSWWPDLVMPSFSPRHYHANWGTPMAAYNALYELMAHFDEQVSAEINVPALVMIDNGDELVSPGGIAALTQRLDLSHWQIQSIEKSDDAQTWYHHLILDDWCLGKQSWHDVTVSIKEFLEVDA